MPRIDQAEVLRWRAVAISNDLTHVAMMLDAGADPNHLTVQWYGPCTMPRRSITHRHAAS